MISSIVATPGLKVKDIQQMTMDAQNVVRSTNSLLLLGFPYIIQNKEEEQILGIYPKMFCILLNQLWIFCTKARQQVWDRDILFL